MFTSFIKSEKKVTQTMNTPLSCDVDRDDNSENVIDNDDYSKNRTKTTINIFLAKEIANCNYTICTFCNDLLAILIPLCIICGIIALITFITIKL